LSRRHFLKIGALSLGGWTVGGLQPLRLTANDSTQLATDRSVILIWLPGGPPHMETFDMKPDAPADYRGDFRPIKTNVPGIEICEHLPLLARAADRYTLIRSVAHGFADHGGGHKRFLTGRDPREPTGFVNDYPAVGSMVAKVREKVNVGIPNYIVGADAGRDGIDVYSFGAAYLGPSTHPFMVPGDPSSPRFEIKNVSLPATAKDRFHDRLDLLQRLEQTPLGISRRDVDGLEAQKRQALNLITADTARVAFDLSREPLQLRERYGMHPWGQRAIMARRLVEYGASFVTMVLENPVAPGTTPYPQNVIYNWDSHAVNTHIFNDARYRLPIFDRTIAALIEDLHDRGLDKKVLLIVTGEFGRTPRISYAENRPGRDHWPQAMSILVSGSGMRTGQVVGSTNARGEHPKDRPLSPNDLWATMFRHLGIDHQITSFLDPTGRPMPILPYGEPIAELL
jgi:hypothetical protein